MSGLGWTPACCSNAAGVQRISMQPMTQPTRSPEEHASDWCLALRAAPDTRQARVDVEGLGTLILTADGEGGWWAVADRCQRCGGALVPVAPVTSTVVSAIVCGACGAKHAPDMPECVCIATLVADDEVYVLRKA